VENPKVCAKCLLELDISEFSKRASGSINARCKTCCRGAVRINKMCKICGNTFPATDKTGDKRLFCSPECKRKSDLITQSTKLAEAALARKGKKAIEYENNKLAYPIIFAEFAELPKGRADALNADSILYFTGLRCRNGHLAPKYTKNRLCVECLKVKQGESHQRRKADGRLKEQMERANRKYRERLRADPEFKARRAQHMKDWREKEGSKEFLSAYMRRQRAENPQYLMRDRLQARLNFVLSCAGEKKSATLEKYIGCTCLELANHIEAQFTRGMSWDNKGTWNIDHIRPCASFDLTNLDQAQVCFNWRNLRPLEETTNKEKQHRYDQTDERLWTKRMRDLGYDGELFLKFE
jgi:hypothetical protein